MRVPFRGFLHKIPISDSPNGFLVSLVVPALIAWEDHRTQEVRVGDKSAVELEA